MNNRFVIVSALYNAEGWVDKSILSVKKQKYKNYIHVIVDDMSTDKSAEIIERTIAGDKNTIFINGIYSYTYRESNIFTFGTYTTTP